MKDVGFEKKENEHIIFLKKQFDNLCLNCNISEIKKKFLFQIILKKYSEEHRFYHTTQHLSEMFFIHNEGVEKNPNYLSTEQKNNIEWAIFFHDIVYNPKAKNNEEESALFFEELLKKELNKNNIEWIKEAILETKFHIPSADKAKQWLFDIDLSILSSDKERFNEYEQQIRNEYSFVPDNIYQEKRKEVMEKFANRKTKVYTKELIDIINPKKAEENLLPFKSKEKNEENVFLKLVKNIRFKK